jgi:ribonuclease HI
VYIFVDGACVGNGTLNAIASSSIFFKDLDNRNYARLLSLGSSNNEAELTAFYMAL